MNSYLFDEFKAYVTLYARISPLGSSGASQMSRAVEYDTSGNDTFDGYEGVSSKVWV